MGTIHVARDGTNIGTFSTEEVREGLRTGRFLPTDMAWEAGMADWRPLSQVLAGKPAAAMPASGTTGTDALSVSPASSSSGAAAPGGGLPWEHREQLGILKAYFDTVSMVLTQPAVAFATMKAEGDMTGPMLFALIGGSAGLIVSFLLQISLHSIGFMGDRQTAMFGLGIAGFWALGYILLVPVLVLVGMFVGSGILHLCLMIVGGANKPFETTFRVVCFSSGSTYLLSMIPFCGGFVAGVWNIVLECIGIARAHETDTGKAVMAVLLPVVVCCGGAFLFVILIGGFGALSQFSRH
jgi:hypothetical protein